MVNSERTPAVVILQTPFVSTPVNQRLPSEPTVIDCGTTTPVGNSAAMLPSSLMTPMAPPSCVNHRLPSGPVTTSTGGPYLNGRGNSVMTPAGVIRPIFSGANSANQTLPSGALVMPPGVQQRSARFDGTGNSVTTGFPAPRAGAA